MELKETKNSYPDENQAPHQRKIKRNISALPVPVKKTVGRKVLGNLFSHLQIKEDTVLSKAPMTKSSLSNGTSATSSTPQAKKNDIVGASHISMAPLAKRTDIDGALSSSKTPNTKRNDGASNTSMAPMAKKTDIVGALSSSKTPQAKITDTVGASNISKALLSEKTDIVGVFAPSKTPPTKTTVPAAVLATSKTLETRNTVSHCAANTCKILLTKYADTNCVDDSLTSKASQANTFDISPLAWSKTSNLVCVAGQNSTSETRRGDPLFLVEKQQQFGIDFQPDNNALRSILSGVGINVDNSNADARRVLKPGRCTEGQRKLWLTPSRVKNSAYYRGSPVRMSLIDSCKRYKNQLTKEIFNVDESASPQLSRPSDSLTFAKSPLLKAWKVKPVPKSVYPKYSLALIRKGTDFPTKATPGAEPKESTECEQRDVHPSKASHNLVSEYDTPFTPQTPIITYGRVPQTPNSSLGSASRQPMFNSTGNCQQKTSNTEFLSKPQRRIQWADILGSPDLLTSFQTVNLDTNAAATATTTSLANTTGCGTNVFSSAATGKRTEPTLVSGQRQAAAKSEGFSTRVAVVVDDDDDSSLGVSHPHWSYHSHHHSATAAKRRVEDESKRGASSQLVKAAVVSASLYRRQKQQQQPCRRQVVVESTAGAPVRVTAGPQDSGGSRSDDTQVERGDVDRARTLAARLQALAKQERRIHNEMQLLKMAMQEEDNNGNHITNNSTTTSNASANQSYHSTTRPSLSSCSSEVPAEYSHASCASHSLEMCNLEFYNPFQSIGAGARASVSSTPCSSSSPDINSNLLTLPQGSTDAGLHRDSKPLSSSRALGFGTGDASCAAGWSQETMAAATTFARAGSGRDDGDSHFISDRSALSREYFPKRQANFSTSDILLSSQNTSNIEANTVIDVIDNFHRRQQRVPIGETVLNHVEGQSAPILANSQPYTNPLKCQDTAELPLNKLYDSAELSQEKSFIRQSMDMDVEDVYQTSDISGLAENAEDGIEIVPTTLPIYELSDPAGRDQTACSSLLSGVSHAKVYTAPVLVKPHAASSEECAGTDAQVIPPIWTALALRSAASHGLSPCSYPAASMDTRHFSQSLSTKQFGNMQQVEQRTSPLQADVEAVVAAVSRSISLSPKALRRHSPAKRNGARNRNRSVSPISPWLLTGVSKRSPMRAKLRRGQGERLGSALREVDLFLEALLEDECALYAGRLQSFLRQSEASVDRKELPDPVAKILTEGDDTHFVPIHEDSSYHSRPLEGSAFACYIPA